MGSLHMIRFNTKIRRLFNIGHSFRCETQRYKYTHVKVLDTHKLNAGDFVQLKVNFQMNKKVFGFFFFNFSTFSFKGLGWQFP